MEERKRGGLTVGVNRNESFKETADHKPCESAELEVIRREKTTSMGGLEGWEWRPCGSPMGGPNRIDKSTEGSETVAFSNWYLLLRGALISRPLPAPFLNSSA